MLCPGELLSEASGVGFGISAKSIGAAKDSSSKGNDAGAGVILTLGGLGGVVSYLAALAGIVASVVGAGLLAASVASMVVPALMASSVTILTVEVSYVTLAGVAGAALGGIRSIYTIASAASRQ